MSVDRRIERTKDQLRTAVLELAETVDLSALTVHDITRRAGVNRATFYQHYRDKDELLEQTIDGLLHELFDGCAPVLAGIDRLLPDAIHPSVVQMFEEVAKRSALYGRLIGHGGSAYFIRRFQSRNEELTLRVMHHMETTGIDGPIPARVRAHFGASATVGLMSYWLENGQKESAQTIAAWCWRLLRPVWFDLDE
ncbi:MAG: TetR/AcrR family transcriptional regulator [Thermomicrobiales bacterium]